MAGDDRWHHANARTAPAGADDGSDVLFEVVNGRPESYVAFATDYYEPERPLDLAAVERIFAHEPMTWTSPAASTPVPTGRP